MPTGAGWSTWLVLVPKTQQLSAQMAQHSTAWQHPCASHLRKGDSRGLFCREQSVNKPGCGFGYRLFLMPACVLLPPANHAQQLPEMHNLRSSRDGLGAGQDPVAPGQAKPCHGLVYAVAISPCQPRQSCCLVGGWMGAHAHVCVCGGGSVGCCEGHSLLNGLCGELPLLLLHCACCAGPPVPF